MLQDRIYYAVVISTLKDDGYNQGKCIYKVIEMGQLATEYADNRKVEFKLMEMHVKKAIKEREKNIEDMQNKLLKVNEVLKRLVRQENVS